MPAFKFRPNTGTRKPTTTGFISKKNTLPKIFNCLFCHAEQSVHVTISRKNKVGSLCCGKCHIKFETEITHLDIEVDVHAKWIDACEEAAKESLELQKEKERTTNGGKKRKQTTGDDDGDIKSAAKRYRVGV